VKRKRGKGEGNRNTRGRNGIIGRNPEAGLNQNVDVIALQSMVVQ
jgi:hypothetical protein